MRLLGMTQAVRKERQAASEARGERHFPLSFASLRIAAAARAAVAAGFPEPDAIAVVSRGYHIAWIPARGAAGKELLFPGRAGTRQHLFPTGT
jgi:putative hydrolase of the HAD superfamily